ncbi:MAG: PHP domain-containing protein [Candidatus Thermoplasmatota archaeon]|nr:PHP domain-containing protein [Candidatus Thermoplasmatota archaeon]
MKGRADIHVHTKYSGLTTVEFINVPDSISEPRDVVRAAESKGLNVLCVTDHNSLKGALRAKETTSKTEVVVGEEIMTSGGEVLGLFLQETVPAGLSPQETIDVIHTQGGIAIAPHPFSPRCKSLGTAVSRLDLDGIEVLNSMHIDGYSNAYAKQAFSGSRLAKVGGSDAHHYSMVGNAYTTFEGTTAEELRKAILQGTTGFGGAQTPLRQIVWMITNLTARVDYTLFRSLLGLDLRDDAEWVEYVSGMSLSTRLTSLVGGTLFLAPPFQLMAGVIGSAVHGSRSRSRLSVMAEDASASVGSAEK